MLLPYMVPIILDILLMFVDGQKVHFARNKDNNTLKKYSRCGHLIELNLIIGAI
jgi:hypothetical protein